MTTSVTIEHARNNRLLALLPEKDLESMLRHLERLPTPLNMVLFERGKPINHVYFPCSGAHSILATMEDGAMVEIGTVGYEGLTTVDILIGAELATETTVCQVPGESLRMPAGVFRSMIAGDTPLRRIAMRFLQGYLGQVSRSVACNRLHNIEERFARWVLMSADRVKGNEFKITQEYLADMLGVHRPSVSLVARTFQQAGIIRYSRGTIMITDRAALEDASCECYGIVKQQFDRLLQAP